MPTPSPYRSLPAERRLALVLHALTISREARALYTQRLISRGGGFRAVTLNSLARRTSSPARSSA